MSIRAFVVAASAVLAFPGLALAAADEYTGPIIDAHAHLRLGKTDGLTPTQPA